MCAKPLSNLQVDFILADTVAVFEFYDTFVNSVFVYDDKLVLTYNYKDGTETLTLQEIESVLSSNLTSMCPPKRNHTKRCGFSFWYGIQRQDLNPFRCDSPVDCRVRRLDGAEL